MPLTWSIALVMAVVAAVGFVAALSYRSLVMLSPWRRVLTTVLRAVLVLLLLLAIFEVKWRRLSNELAVLFVLDYSDSVSTEAKQWALHYLRAAADQMRPEDRAGLLVFGEEAYVEVAPRRREGFVAELERIATLPTTTYTNIARAIRLALAVFPEEAQRRIVLLTDGEENLGDARGEAIVAGAGRTPIEVVPLRSTRDSEVLIERLIVPARVQQDSAFDVKLLLHSTQSGPARVRLFQDGHYLGQKEVELVAGKNAFAYPQKLTQPGFHTFEARVEALGDHRAENNVAVGYSVVHGPPKVLYLVNVEQERLSPVPRYLEQEGIPVEVRSRAGVPSELTQLQNYDCVVLDNMPGESFSRSQMRLLERYVHDLGGGLVMIGGRDSFGPGGYVDTPVEEALPVDMTIKDKRHFPSFAQVIVIDKSGSMGMTAPSGKQKIELAAEGAIASLGLLNDRDYIGVIATDTQPKWVAPLRRARDRGAIARDIATLRAGGGGIYVFSGLREAFEALATNESMLRHIILFADGQDAEQHEGCPELVERMVQMNMTLTSVALGQGQDVPFLTEIAEKSGGRFHLTEDIDQVPRIFTKETILAQRSYLVEEPFEPVVASEGPVLRGISLETIPPLLGYVGTTAKSRAEVLLVSHRTDPLLATWRYGLGKAVAFTSDTQPRWAQSWIGWEEFGKFWTQVIRWALRGATATHLQTQVKIVQGEGILTIDALDEDGNFLNFLDLGATIVTPSMERIELSPSQSAPGRYEATFRAREIGAYMVSVVDRTAGSSAQGSQDVTGIALSYPVEFKPSGKGPSLIKQLVETTRGRILEGENELEGVFSHNLEPHHAVIPIWQSLIWFVAVLLPADIALRRIALSAEQWESAQRWVMFWTRRVRGAAGAQTDATMTRLKEVKAGLAESRKGPAPAGRIEEIERLQQELRQSIERRLPAAQVAPKRQESAAEPPAGEKPAKSGDSAYTRRLLEAKKRARDRQPPSSGCHDR